mmetsp:Transcript_11762/g.19916  ORF Transcript_11762/g.19916 Transcript_11762/m.19916 type:complete len:99 (-) Transcript_11762:530-826(-)
MKDWTEFPRLKGDVERYREELGVSSLRRLFTRKLGLVLKLYDDLSKSPFRCRSLMRSLFVDNGRPEYWIGVMRGRLLSKETGRKVCGCCDSVFELHAF